MSANGDGTTLLLCDGCYGAATGGVPECKDVCELALDHAGLCGTHPGARADCTSCGSTGRLHEVDPASVDDAGRQALAATASGHRAAEGHYMVLQLPETPPPREPAFIHHRRDGADFAACGVYAAAMTAATYHAATSDWAKVTCTGCLDARKG